MIQSLKIHPINDGTDEVAKVTAYLDNGLILCGITIIRDEDTLKIDRNTRPLFTTKDLRRTFCDHVIEQYKASLIVA